MGKKSPPPPDYGPLAAASERSAEIMAGLGYEQLDFARQQYDDMLPTLQGISDSQIASQNEQLRQARDLYDYQVDTFRPLERSIVQQAQDFNTGAYREQLASQAAADSGLAARQTRAANERASASMGVNPNSGRFAGINAASDLGLAAQRAAAMTNTRTQAEQLGFARSLDASGLGRNLSGASLAAYGGALNAGNSAGQNMQAPGQNYMGNMAIGSGTIASGQQMQLQGLSTVLNAQTNAYVNSNDSFLGDVGGIMGGVAGLAKAGLFGSDRRLKRDIKAVGTHDETGLTLYSFSYRNEPDRRFIGVMADEVQELYPEAVVEHGGYLSVNYGALGIEMREVR